MSSDDSGSFIGLASSLGSSVLSLIGQNAANKSNERIARDTNATNMAINDKQLQHQREQWLRETQYNNPSAQVQRLRAAGLNPQSLVTNGNAQPMQFNSPIPMQSYQKQNIVPDNVFGAAYTAYQQGQVTKEAITRQKRENYLLGVQASFAIQKEQLEVRRRIGELISQGVKTDLDKEQLNNLKIRDAQLEEQLKRQARIDEQSLRNMQADEQEKLANTKRQDALANASIKRMSQQSAVEWFNANTGRTGMLDTLMNSHAARQIQQKIHQKLLVDMRYYDSDKRIANSLADYQKQLARLSVDQQRQIMAMTAIQLAHETEKDVSVIAELIRKTTGIDLSNILGPALQYLK